MFKSKTVFVIGAGASEEADLPIGKTLTDSIAALVDFKVEHFETLTRGDQQLYNVIKMMVQDDPQRWKDNHLLRSGHELAEAMKLAPSIDTFLQTHKNNQEFKVLGKLGIAKAILQAENSSKMAPTGENYQPFEMRLLADTWYLSLAQHLFSGVPADDPGLAFKNVSFIVFNYDRCLELFLRRAVKVYFPQYDGIEELMSKVDIVHPYGSLGALRDSGEDGVPYGHSRSNIMGMANRILTFSETIEDDDRVDKMKALVKHAETLIFLGFAFHEQNMDLLGEDVPKNEKQNAIERVYATTYGVSESDQQIIRGQIGRMLKGRPIKARDTYSIVTFDGKCKKLFAEYWKSLSAAATDQQNLTKYDINALS